MRKFYSYLVVLMILFWCSGAFAGPVTVSWRLYEEPEKIDGIRLYVGPTSGSAESVILIGKGETTITFQSDLPVVFMSLTAFGDVQGVEEESGHTYELIEIQSGNGSFDFGFEVTIEGYTVKVTWDELPNVNGYKLRWESDDGSFYYADVSGGIYSFEIVSGNYTFSLFYLNSEGETIEGSVAEESNVYIPWQAVVLPPPEPPNYFVESFGVDGIAGWDHMLMIPFENNGGNPEVEFHRVTLYSSSADALSLNTDEAISTTLVPAGLNFYQVINSYDYPIVFFTISSVDHFDREGDLFMGDKIPGDVIGTDNEGIPFHLTRINLDDYNVLRTYYFKSFDHGGLDLDGYCNASNLYEIIESYIEDGAIYHFRMDYDLSGLVNGAEYNFFRVVYGTAGEGT